MLQRLTDLEDLAFDFDFCRSERHGFCVMGFASMGSLIESSSFWAVITTATGAIKCSMSQLGLEVTYR